MNSAGVSNSQFHVNFGTILLSQFIKALNASVPNGDVIFEQLQPYLNEQRTTSSLAITSDFLPLDVDLIASANQATTTASLSNKYLSNPRKCCCAVQQCSSAPRPTVRSVNNKACNWIRQRPFLIAMGILCFVNMFQLTHSAVLMKYFKVINIIQETVAHFIMVAFINISLLVCFLVYIVIICYQRAGKPGWNQSFSTIVQCFLLACSLVEINQSVLTKSYISDYEAVTTSFFKSGIKNYDNKNEVRIKIDWIQKEFSCCGYSGNATKDWLNSSISFPASCCKPDILNCTDVGHYERSCLGNMQTTIQPILHSFMWTSILTGVFHLFFIIYVCILFNVLRSNVRRNNRTSVGTAFTIP